MGKVLCFGEILMRMSPDTESKWLQQNALPVFIGGAELNVASALASWKIPVAYSTAMPSNYLSQQLLQYVAEKNIDTSPVHFSGERIGAYLSSAGSGIKKRRRNYDRAYSSSLS
jgi:2-dehydro-3-deoxygluconokinase